ncbi:MAG: hypothetical protein M3Q69_01085 [Acidobacteriota bacterium]|nr:hypothetical protein [Acidobacteriota bacterium]
MGRNVCPAAARGLIVLLFFATTAQAARPLLPRQLCGAKQAVAEVVTPRENPDRTAYLGDWVTIYICHQDAFALDAAQQQKNITLFVNGIDTGVVAQKTDAVAGTMTFPLDRNDTNKAIWAPILYDPIFHSREEIAISAGMHGDRPLPRLATSNMRIIFDKIYLEGAMWLWVVLIFGIVVATILYARNSDMLRDGPAVGSVRQTYSLARVQMAWWFVLVVVAFVIIWMVTGDRDTISASLLGLMGISAATALTAVAITPRGEERAAAERDRLTSIKTSAAARIQQLDSEIATTADPTAKTKLTQLKTDAQSEIDNANIALAEVKNYYPSQNIWIDLVTDARGSVALDRFQIVVWTIVLGGIFVASVVWDLTMPEFNATLLALMGISSGTYVGFKIPQKS